jgi:hypothetical protein
MKNTRILLAIALTSLVFTAGCLSIKGVEANAYVFSLMPREYIHSPLSQTYITNAIVARATIEVSPKVYDKAEGDIMEFYLDSKTNFKMYSILANYQGNSSDGRLIFNGETIIGNLSNGDHILEMGFRSTVLGNVDPPIIHFRIEANSPSANLNNRVSISSPKEITYSQSSVPLTFTATQSDLEINYKLDSDSYRRASDNTILENLSNGTHTLTVYPIDAFDNLGASQSISFTVNSTPLNRPTSSPTATDSTQNPSPTPTVSEFSWLAIAPMLLVVLSVALLLRRRKTI